MFPFMQMGFGKRIARVRADYMHFWNRVFEGAVYAIKTVDYLLDDDFCRPSQASPPLHLLIEKGTLCIGS